MPVRQAGQKRNLLPIIYRSGKGWEKHVQHESRPNPHPKPKRQGFGGSGRHLEHLLRREVHRAGVRCRKAVVRMFRRQVVRMRIVGTQFERPAGSPATVMVVGKQHDHEQQRNGHDNAEYAFAVFHAAKISIIRQEPVTDPIYLCRSLALPPPKHFPKRKSVFSISQIRLRKPQKLASEEQNRV